MEDDDLDLEIPKDFRLGPYSPVLRRASLIVNPHGGILPDGGAGTNLGLLASPLDLAGYEAMIRSAHGGFPALDALVEAAPWSRQVMTDIERQLLAQIALGRPWAKFDPILLVAGPGTGKTWFARQLARALRLPTGIAEMGNMSDDRQISGTPRGWSSAQAAWPLLVIANTRAPNPLIVLDEIDKAGGSDRNGMPHRALLSMIEPTSARDWHDPYLLANCDLSQINWVACANEIKPIPQALLSRFQVVHVPAPRPQDFEPMLESMIASLAVDWQVPFDMLPAMPPSARKLLRDRFLRQLSLRQLARDVRRILTALLADGKGPMRH